jgi:hypothetical protein
MGIEQGLSLILLVLNLLNNKIFDWLLSSVFIRYKYRQPAVHAWVDQT